MLTKEKLSEITENAIEDLHYTYVVAKVSSQNSFAIRLYGQLNDELVANSYIYEGDKPGRFTIDFVLERSNVADREVLRDIISQLYEYFDEQLQQKYYIKLLNTNYGYLALDERTDFWIVTSLKLAEMNNQKVAFTADEINEMANSEVFDNLNPLDLWHAAEEVKED